MPDPAVPVTQAREGQRTRDRAVLHMMARVARASRVLVDRNTLALVARLMQGQVGLLSVAQVVQHIAVREGLPLRDRGVPAIQGRVGHAIRDPVGRAVCAQPTASSDFFNPSSECPHSTPSRSSVGFL
jgi:hypothetical protein